MDKHDLARDPNPAVPQSDSPQVPVGAATPPGQVSGYDLLRRIGIGAYGEVWIAIDRNTNRKVAIKFFAHRARHDPTLLAREIEKLVQLSTNRSVVQLYEVGWDANPPYYVMEYLESGSLEDRLRREGPMSVAEAVELFREIAVGLSRAHGKGILHCDLKPANILLDQFQHPRLADFGQSRLANEQRPALGTMFYMAPEQADLNSLPDTRWDIYALGAIFYCLVVGSPPHRNDANVTEIETAPDLSERLRRYRKLLRTGPPPSEHRMVPGMDRALADIIDRCLAADPEQRFPHAASLLNELENRDRLRARRPYLVLGLVGPILLLLTMTFFAARAYRGAVAESLELIRKSTWESNRFAAEAESKNVANELEKRFRELGEVAERPELVTLLGDLLKDPPSTEPLVILRNPTSDASEMVLAKAEFRRSATRQALERLLGNLLTDPRLTEVASWLLTDSQGNMLAAVFAEATSTSPVGDNFAYRSYFHGGENDLQVHDRVPPPLRETSLSAPFRSTTTGAWKVAISTPIREGSDTLGVLVMTVDLGKFVGFASSAQQSALLVDARPGEFEGMVLEHPLFAQVLRQRDQLPARFSRHRLDLKALRAHPTKSIEDPLGADELGGEFHGKWIASMAPVRFNRIHRDDRREPYDTGLLMLVQSRETTANRAVENLAQWLFRQGMAALMGFVLVVLATWLSAVQFARFPRRRLSIPQMTLTPSAASVHSRETVDLKD